MKARKNVGRRATILRCDPEKDVAHDQHTGFDKKIQVNIGGLSNSLSHWVRHQRLVCTLDITSVRESVETRVVGMRNLISCMTRNIPYRIALFIWNVIEYFHSCHCMCILGGK